ncbi:MAG: DUF4179 domain-containing protein [Clostridium sp.]
MNSNDKSKLDINNIVIPDSLNEVVNSSLKRGRRRRITSKLKGVALSLAVVIISFILGVNTIDAFASVAYKIPYLRELTRLVDFDKGYQNSIDKNLIKEIGYVETKSGVTLKVNSVVGDYKSLWVGHNVISNYDLDEQVAIDHTKTNATVGWTNFNDSGAKNRYITMIFKEPTKEFVLNYIYTNRETNKVVAKFSVPIKLSDEMLKSTLKKENIKPINIDTSGGNLKIYDFASTITRTKFKINLESNKYKYSALKDPELIIDGKSHRISPGFYSTEGEEDVVEFEGSIQGAKSIEFKCSGVYYMNREGNRLYIDFKKKTITPNDYGIEINYINTMGLGLKTTKIKHLTNGNVYNMEGAPISSSTGVSDLGDESKGLEIEYIIPKNIDRGYIDISGAYMGLTEKICINLK